MRKSLPFRSIRRPTKNSMSDRPRPHGFGADRAEESGPEFVDRTMAAAMGTVADMGTATAIRAMATGTAEDTESNLPITISLIIPADMDTRATFPTMVGMTRPTFTRLAVAHALHVAGTAGTKPISFLIVFVIRRFSRNAGCHFGS